jgi:hypothetical protein
MKKTFVSVKTGSPFEGKENLHHHNCDDLPLAFGTSSIHFGAFFLRLKRLSFVANRRRVCLVIHGITSSSVCMEEVRHAGGIWKSIGKANAIYHMCSCCARNNFENAPWVVMLRAAQVNPSLTTAHCPTSPRHSFEVQMSKNWKN